MGRRLIAMILLLVLAGCTPQELSEFFAVEDLRSSAKPEEAAAGHAVEAIDDDRAAQELADEALRDKDGSQLEQAMRDRPQDARYGAYLGLLALMEGRTDNYAGYFLQSRSLYVAQRPHDDDASAERLRAEWTLVVLGEFDHALAIERARSPIDEKRIERLEWGYCANLYEYLDVHDSLPGDLENVLTVDEGRCDGYW